MVVLAVFWLIVAPPRTSVPPVGRAFGAGWALAASVTTNAAGTESAELVSRSDASGNRPRAGVGTAAAPATDTVRGREARPLSPDPRVASMQAPGGPSIGM